MATHDEVDKVLAILLANWPALRVQQPLEAISSAWYMGLADLEPDGLMQAVQQVITTATFFPCVAELRKAYFELGEMANGIPAAQEAWAEVKHAFHRGFSRWHAPTCETWTHPIVHRALDCIGGWYALCDSENDAADRARFIEAYNVLLGRARDRERMSPAVREYIEQLAAKMMDHVQLGPGVNR